MDADFAPARPQDRRMIVGREIRLKGEITDCDLLVVEGTIEATIVARAMEIAINGSYTGTANVEEAEIAGHFSGELTVSGLLRVTARGRVDGALRYGRLEVAAGGTLSGTLSVLPAPVEDAETIMPVQTPDTPPQTPPEAL